jgi:hypothetical protein
MNQEKIKIYVDNCLISRIADYFEIDKEKEKEKENWKYNELLASGKLSINESIHFLTSPKAFEELEKNQV